MHKQKAVEGFEINRVNNENDNNSDCRILAMEDCRILAMEVEVVLMEVEVFESLNT